MTGSEILNALKAALLAVPAASLVSGLTGSGIGGWTHRFMTEPDSSERQNFEDALKTGFLIGALGGGSMATGVILHKLLTGGYV